MDKFGRQLGNGVYDSDQDADDGYGGGAVPPPFDDDDGDSDHPSESEDDSVMGGDTPTTQGWGDRETASPTGSIKQWTTEQVAQWLVSLSPALAQYRSRMFDEYINGEALVEMGHDELKEMDINSVGHRLTILKAVYEQKVKAGIAIEEGHYVPLTAEGEKAENAVTQDDVARIIRSIKLRDQRIMAGEAEMQKIRGDLERLMEENRKLKEETLPIMRHWKDQRTPLPDPAGGATLPSPREPDLALRQEAMAPPKESKTSGLSRKFSTKKLYLGSAPKQPSPTHPPPTYSSQVREVRDDGGGHLEASAAAMAASTHLTASVASQTSPNSVHSQLSPTSPAYSTHAPSSGGSHGYGPTSAPNRSFQHGNQHGHGHDSQWTASTASTLVNENMARQDRRRGQAPTPSPRDDEPGSGGRGGDRAERGDRDNPQVEIFKSFRVSIDDPCRVVLPVALKRYNISDDWRQYALYIVHGDQERCLGLDEKPLLLFKQLDKEGRKPMFMLRRHASPQEGWSGAAGGGNLQDGNSAKQIPGGVL